MQNLKVGKIYKLTKRIGQGAFGEIFLAINTKTSEDYAVKLESVKCPHPQLFFEAKLYQYIHSEPTDFDKGIPKVYYSGTEGEYNIMVMDLLGLCLEDCFNKTNRRFSLKTVLLLIDQMLVRIEYLHSRFFIHRDLKPDNFLMGIRGNSHRLYLVDYGLAKKYMGKDGKHIPYKENKNLTGTARYASVNTHLGVEQSRRDDLESIGYIVMYFLRGSLPWMNLKQGGRDDRYEKIMEKKLATSSEALCKGYPNEFCTYLNYAKALKFEEKPDYKYLRMLFRDLMSRNGWEYDGLFDWTQSEDIILKNKEMGENNRNELKAENLRKEIAVNNENNENLKNNGNNGNNNKKKEEIVIEKKLENEKNNKNPALKPKEKAPEEVKVANKQQVIQKTQPAMPPPKPLVKKNSIRDLQEQKGEKMMLKTFQSSQNYNGPRIVVNKATYK